MLFPGKAPLLQKRQNFRTADVRKRSHFPAAGDLSPVLINTGAFRLRCVDSSILTLLDAL